MFSDYKRLMFKFTRLITALFTVLAITALAITTMGGFTVQAETPNAEQRLTRLENMLNSQVLIEQSQLMEQVKQELSSLREQIEMQENQLNMIKQRQRNLYQDIDRRLNDLEIKSGGRAAPLGASSSHSPVAPPSSSIKPPGSTSPAPKGVPRAASQANLLAPVKGDKHGKQAYEQAFKFLKGGNYKQAMMAFRAFQQNYPESIYGGNAQYWLGEAYWVSRDFKSALSEFQKVISHYPQHSKVEGAMLKIGYTYYEMKDWASARSALESVIAKYPKSTVARKAKERLQRIKREGH